MSESSAVGGLKWVKSELIDSLRRVRAQLEALIASEGQADCRDAIGALYEVRGVLSALELIAPARLAEEMQRLLERLADGSLSNQDEAAEALMLALIQLPNYLNRLEAGNADPPVILLPSINDLRVSRGIRPLKAAELFAPSPGLAGQQTPTPEVLSALASVVAKVRPHYHRYLLQVFQGEAGPGLVGLGRMFNQLHRFFDQGVFCDAFRAADATVVGILSGSIPLNSATKALLGHIDTIFKPVLDPEPVWPGPQARRLIDECLAVLSGLDAASQLVSDLYGKYVNPVESEEPPDLGESARRSTLGVDALGSLAEELLRELASIKDNLDLFVRGGAEDLEQLASIEAGLHQLASTLAIGDEPDLVRRLQALAEEIGGLSRGETKADDSFLMSFARDLLVAEDALRRLAPTAESGASDADVLLGVTLREARADLAKAKQAVADYALEQGDPGKLGDVPHLLPGVSAALYMLGEEAAAKVVEGVGEMLRQRLGEGGWVPSPMDLDLLAEAISGVDLYMEGKTQGASFGDNLLARAHAAVETLKGGQRAPVGRESAPSLSASPDSFDEARETPPAGDAAAAAEPFLTPETKGAVPLAQEPEPVSGFAETAAQIDPEFLDIFLEEAREEQGRIDETLGRWTGDPVNRDALVILRRSFHTLKGSGRLVGATRLAELAAVTESLLEQVLSGVLVASGPVIEQVVTTARALPGLIEAEASDQPADLSALLRGAANLLAGPKGELTSAGLPTEEVTSTAALPAREPAEADSELLDIFVAEAGGHLATLTAFLAKAGPDDELRPEPDMMRALHTLRGSAGMAGIDSIAGVSGALDDLFGELNARGLAGDASVRALLVRACEGLAERLDHLPNPGPEISSLANVALEAAEWTERLIATLPEPLSHLERGLDTLPETELIELLDVESEIPEAESEAFAVDVPVEAEPEPVAFEAPVEAEPEPIAFETPVEAEPEPVAFETPVEAEA